MSPEVVAAIIAASVSFLTLIGSLLAQIYGIRRTSRDTEKTINANQEQMDQTLAEQREQLNRTLTEQRKQLAPPAAAGSAELALRHYRTARPPKAGPARGASRLPPREPRSAAG